MSEEGVFWATIWAIVAAVTIVIASCITLGIQSSNEKVVEMVKSGADPIAAYCAVTGISGTGSAAMCTLAATRSTK